MAEKYITASRHGHASKKYHRHSPTYQSWTAMRWRCSNSKSASFHRYGGRGIKVCERWSDFKKFLEDMGEKPKGTSLDRIDVNGDYNPHNCRWATPKQQIRNREHTVTLTYNGQTLPIAEWAERIGINASTLRCRIFYGWTAERAITTPCLTRQDIGKLLNAKLRKKRDSLQKAIRQ